MRIELDDPSHVAGVLAFLRGHVHVNADQVGLTEIEVSQLGSMDRDGRRLELDLMLQVWRARNPDGAARIVD